MATIAIVASLAVVGCGDDERAERPGTQPAPDVTTFEQGTFDNLQLYPRSDPIGPRSENDGVVAQSFVTRGASPEQILDWYAQTLQPQGWELIGGIQQVGSTAWRADFRSESLRLRVSAAPAPTVEKEELRSSDDYDVQYSLTLRPT